MAEYDEFTQGYLAAMADLKRLVESRHEALKAVRWDPMLGLIGNQIENILGNLRSEFESEGCKKLASRPRSP